MECIQFSSADVLWSTTLWLCAYAGSKVSKSSGVDSNRGGVMKKVAARFRSDPCAHRVLKKCKNIQCGLFSFKLFIGPITI